MRLGSVSGRRAGSAPNWIRGQRRSTSAQYFSRTTYPEDEALETTVSGTVRAFRSRLRTLLVNFAVMVFFFPAFSDARALPTVVEPRRYREAVAAETSSRSRAVQERVQRIFSLTPFFSAVARLPALGRQKVAGVFTPGCVAAVWPWLLSPAAFWARTSKT